MARCIVPIMVRGVLVPCGKCPECRKARISQWSFRLMQEEKVSFCADFVTLTYDTEHVPITPKGFMSLCKRDVQLWLKRLRKAHEGCEHKIKYYAAGEYGGRTLRPHYHVLLFNAVGAQIDVPRTWDLGSVHFGKVSGASVGYTLKYICKKGIIPLHGNDDRVREFALMSKGLGLSYSGND